MRSTIQTQSTISNRSIFPLFSHVQFFFFFFLMIRQPPISPLFPSTPLFRSVLMDVHMPGSDATAATRRTRAIEAERELARTPIIALTANALDEDRDACLAAGMDGFLTKPLDREQLAAVLASANAKRKAA